MITRFSALCILIAGVCVWRVNFSMFNAKVNGSRVFALVWVGWIEILKFIITGSLDDMNLMHAHQKWPRFYFFMDGVCGFVTIVFIFLTFILFRFQSSFRFILGTSFFSCWFVIHLNFRLSTIHSHWNEVVAVGKSVFVKKIKSHLCTAIRRQWLLRLPRYFRA